MLFLLSGDFLIMLCVFGLIFSVTRTCGNWCLVLGCLCFFIEFLHAASRLQRSLCVVPACVLFLVMDKFPFLILLGGSDGWSAEWNVTFLDLLDFFPLRHFLSAAMVFVEGKVNIYYN